MTESSTFSPHQESLARMLSTEDGMLGTLPDGRSLAEFVASATQPLSGSLPGYVLNPVRVGERTAFAVWTAGSYALYEVVHPSANYFEFATLHLGKGPAMLERIARDGELTDSMSLPDAIRFGLREAQRGLEPKAAPWVERWTQQWWTQECLASLSVAQRSYASMDEVLDALRRHPVPPPPADGFVQCFRALVRLSQQRTAKETQ